MADTRVFIPQLRAMSNRRPDGVKCDGNIDHPVKYTTGAQWPLGRCSPRPTIGNNTDVGNANEVRELEIDWLKCQTAKYPE